MSGYLRVVRVILGLVGLCMAMVLPAAAVATAPTISFSASNGNFAGWVKGVDAPGDNDGEAIRLSLPTTGSAVVNLGDVGSSPPSSPPSFWFRPALGFPPNGDYNALAQVQVDISFSDSVTVSSTSVSDPWTADGWRLVGGPRAGWSTACQDPGCGDGGSHPGSLPCHNIGGTYQQTIACPLAYGATVTGASVRAVFFFGPGTGPDLFVDDLLYDGATFTTGGPGTVVSVTNPWTPPSLVGIARVNRRTGRGTVRADCPPAWQPCFFALALAVNRNRVPVGTLNGTVWHQSGKVAVHLNRKGRALLRAKRTMRLILSGTWPGGTPVTTGTRLAVKAMRARA